MYIYIQLDTSHIHIPLSLIPIHTTSIRISVHHHDILTSITIPIPSQTSTSVPPIAWDICHHDTMSIVTSLSLHYSTHIYDKTMTYTDMDTNNANTLVIKVVALISDIHTGLNIYREIDSVYIMYICICIYNVYVYRFVY